MQDKAGVFYAGPNKCFLKQDQTSVFNAGPNEWVLMQDKWTFRNL